MTTNNSRGSILVFTAIIIAALIIGGAIIWTKSKKIYPPASFSANFNQDDSNDNPPKIGDPEAPVVVTVFSDFQCHFCKQFAQNIEPQIIEKYVKSSKVKIIYRDFPFLSQESNWAAEAARCANEQGKYQDYMEKLHLVQTGHDPAVFSREKLKNMGQEIGLNVPPFNECFESGKYVAKVKNSFEQGTALGVDGTPTVFINDQKISGAQPWSAYETAIEDELAKIKK